MNPNQHDIRHLKLGETLIEIDHVADRLDELADLAEYWKRYRAKGRNPSAIRAAMLQIVEEITAEVSA